MVLLKKIWTKIWIKKQKNKRRLWILKLHFNRTLKVALNNANCTKTIAIILFIIPDYAIILAYDCNKELFFVYVTMVVQILTCRHIQTINIYKYIPYILYTIIFVFHYLNILKSGPLPGWFCLTSGFGSREILSGGLGSIWK